MKWKVLIAALMAAVVQAEGQIFIGGNGSGFVDLSVLKPIVPYASPVVTSRNTYIGGTYGTGGTYAGGNANQGVVVAPGTSTIGGNNTGTTATGGSTVASGTATTVDSYTGSTASAGNTPTGSTYNTGGTYSGSAVNPAGSGFPAAENDQNVINLFNCSNCGNVTVWNYVDQPVLNPQANVYNVAFPAGFETDVTTMGGIHPVAPYHFEEDNIDNITVPVGNYLAPGVDAEIVPMIEPNDPCAIEAWSPVAMVGLKLGYGAVSNMTRPDQFFPVSQIHWYDVVNLPGFFRNMPPTFPEFCLRRGTKLVFALIVRQTPVQVDLDHVVGGAFSSESNLSILRIIDWRQRGFGPYGAQGFAFAEGFNWGADRIRGSFDDVTAIDGFPGSYPVDELYYTGKGFVKHLGYPENLPGFQAYFAGRCIYMSGWYIVFGKDRSLLAALRADVPVDWVPTMRYYITTGAPGYMMVDINGWKNGLFWIEGTNANPNDPNTAWIKYNDYGLPQGRYVIRTAQLTTYLRVRMKQTF